MTASASVGWISIVALILLLGLMSGFWIGLCGLWKARRGKAWSLMALGVTITTLAPILYSVGNWMLIDSLAKSLGDRRPSTLSPAASGFMIGGAILLPVGVILFSVGFAIHGHAAARIASRAEELEQLASAMSDEINRLRTGGPKA